jgi:hypothetical protein
MRGGNPFKALTEKVALLLNTQDESEPASGALVKEAKGLNLKFNGEDVEYGVTLGNLYIALQQAGLSPPQKSS